MIIYISGVHIISAAKVGTADDVIAIALMTAVTLVTLLIPILLYVIFPKRARKMLGSLKDWLFKHNKVIGAAILLLIGGVLLFNAVSYTHLRAHETRHDLVCRLLLEKKKNYKPNLSYITYK